TSYRQSANSSALGNTRKRTQMTFRKLPVFIAFAVATSGFGLAAAQDHGRGRGNDHHFSDHDRDAVRVWVKDHHDHPPTGFRDRDRLPPDLESQLRIGFVLDRGWRARMHPISLCCHVAAVDQLSETGRASRGLARNTTPCLSISIIDILLLIIAHP